MTKKEQSEARFKRVADFCAQEKDLLIIAGDPQSDQMFVGYGDLQSLAVIRNRVGMKTHVVRNVLKKSRFKGQADNLIMSIAETLWSPITRKTQDFYNFIDGVVCNIAHALDRQNRETIIKTSENEKVETQH